MAVVIMGMLDEREGVLAIVKRQIEKRGHKTLLIDISVGIGGIVPSLAPDVTCREILEPVGGTVEEVRGMMATERDKAIAVMAKGLTQKLLALHKSGDLKGVIAIAGMTGTFLSLTAMNVLPFGVPKLLISSVVAMPAYANWIAEHLGLRDITVMNTVVDTVGMNPLVRTLALNGANAISGMVESGGVLPASGRPSVAITEFDFCDEGAHYVREILEGEYDVVSFHAQGLGDRAAVDFVKQGFFEGFIDLVPAGFGEYLLGGNRATGPDRLDGAADLPIPYVLSPCGFDMISCGPFERKDKGDLLWVSRRLQERKLFLQDSVRVQARTSPEEMELIAIAVAHKLDKYKYKEMVKFVIPGKGFSALSVKGGALHDPESDTAFIETLKKSLDRRIVVTEVDEEINSRAFAAAVADAYRQALAARPLHVKAKIRYSGWAIGQSRGS
ncbi:MAG TPA: Tm-1-like ATP-binding domain-containing protein [Syntrophorhabdaceae bacterium]|jgi:uncharacterized protein (UPF0261 family)